jgi:hypothetical protein
MGRSWGIAQRFLIFLSVSTVLEGNTKNKMEDPMKGVRVVCLSGSSLFFSFFIEVINSGEAVMEFINVKFILNDLFFMPD